MHRTSEEKCCCVVLMHVHHTHTHARRFATTGMQVPLCLQVRKQQQLDGVVCIDLTIEEYFDGAPYYSDQDTSRAIVINSDLNTLVHPLLLEPTDINDGLSFVNITSLENSLPIESILRCHSQSCHVSHAYIQRLVWIICTDRVTVHTDVISCNFVLKAVFMFQ